MEAITLICAPTTCEANATAVVASVPQCTVADRALPSGQVCLACSLELKLQGRSTPASVLGSLPGSMSHDSMLWIPTLIYVG